MTKSPAPNGRFYEMVAVALGKQRSNFEIFASARSSEKASTTLAATRK